MAVPNSDARLAADLAGQSTNPFINRMKNSCRLQSLPMSTRSTTLGADTGTNSRTTYFHEKTKKTCERRVGAPMDKSHMLGPTLWQALH